MESENHNHYENLINYSNKLIRSKVENIENSENLTYINRNNSKHNAIPKTEDAYLLEVKKSYNFEKLNENKENNTTSHRNRTDSNIDEDCKAPISTSPSPRKFDKRNMLIKKNDGPVITNTNTNSVNNFTSSDINFNNESSLTSNKYPREVVEVGNPGNFNNSKLIMGNTSSNSNSNIMNKFVESKAYEKFPVRIGQKQH